jgi:hypothetical protein
LERVSGGDRLEAAFAALHKRYLPLPEEGDALGLEGERFSRLRDCPSTTRSET